MSLRFLRPAVRAALAFGLLLSVIPMVPASAASSRHGRVARAAGTPGVPQDPIVMYAEDFEHDPADTPIRLTAYTGAAPLSQTYTADAGWLKGCNGWVLDDSSTSDAYKPGIADCGNSTKFWNQIRDLADVLGEFNGSADSNANHAVAAFTWTAPAAGSVEFETDKPIPLTASNRFLTFSVNSVAVNCSVSAPKLSFSLLNGSAATSVTAKPVNPCTDPDAKSYTSDVAGTAKAVRGYADKPLLFTGNEVGIRMTNGNGSGTGNDAAFDDIELVDVTPQIDKAFSPAAVASGGTTTLTFTITNTSDLLAKPGWSFTDALPAGMTVAAPLTTSTTCANGKVTATAGGASVGLAGDLKEDQASCTLSVGVTAPKGTYRNCAANTSELVGVNPPDCATVLFDDPSYAISKVSSPPSGTAVQPGEKVTYTVTVTNTGRVPVDATVADDLSGVLDDASYNGDAVAGTGKPAYAEPKLLWAHTLPVGGSTTITYSITLHDPGSGDGVLTNQVTGSDESNCPTGTEPGCTTTVGPAKLKIVKTADATTPVQPGQKITYTLTVTNTGIGTATAVTVTDDLGGVLDDAAFSSAAASGGAVGFDSPTLTWKGDVTAGTPVTITYSVVVNATGGDRTLKNVVTGPPGSNCEPGSDDPQCTVSLGVPRLDVRKSATASATPVIPGTTVTYQVTIANTGGVDYAKTTVTDDLSGVLDDASYNGDAVVSSGEATFASPVLSWTGDVAVDATVTITYTVTVKNPLSGDGKLGNVVTGPPGSNCLPGSADPACSAQPKAAALTIHKSANTTTAKPGDVVTYTVTVTNTGAAYPDAQVTDNLSGVLDDAVYNGDVTADSGKTAYEQPTLTWTGDVLAGATVTVKYSVKVRQPVPGDHVLGNIVTGPPGSNCPAEPADPACSTTVNVADLVVGKSAHASATPLTPGATVTYTITVANPGTAAYAGAAVTDDLSRVLDDAGYNGDVTADGGKAAYERPTLSWSGDVAAGATVTITYSVTVTGGGDGLLANGVVGPGPSNCAQNSLCGTPNLPVAELRIAKSSDGPALGPLDPGGIVKYTVTISNIGTAAYPAAEVADDLTNVLDDAAYNGDVAADAGKVAFEAPTLTWTGDVAAGATVTITYSVTVDDPDAGDRILTNVVTGPPGSNCANGSSDPACRERVPRADVAVAKTADRTHAGPGQIVTYTVRITNSGKAAYPAYAISDDLSGVLDDAVYDDDASADSGHASYAQPTLSWTGDVPAGSTITVTYSVTVGNPLPAGDDKLINAVTGPPGSGCAPADPGDGCTTVVDAPRLDFGDQPDSYQTTRATGGAYHRIVATLRLGAGITADSDGRPSVQADGDQDDGVVAVRGATAGSDQLSVDVRATNLASTEAVLAGWVDFDADTDLDSVEAQQVVVPAGTSAATFTLTWPTHITGGQVLRLRLRLFGDLPSVESMARLELTPAISPIGFGGAGEVEDYVWDIPGTPPSQYADRPDQLSDTGDDVLGLAQSGAALILVGAFLAAIGRRRCAAS
ncbi:MAG: DUF11 domain-containing protein [Hamadaea sp.]|uniref:DUF7927 domain-containing protein n=1 Tax=Hamadaea sp. TaxID=2024425 RepID=UPI0017B812CD|nr:GEVED domain-containing protein [Hamadaea sp.]NUT18685.1 DUF11 domain-containing protein [Hamadaea sp.]